MKAPRLHGLPLHPLLVHFPVAAWTVATGLAVLALLRPAPGVAELARLTNAFGLVGGALAMLAGLGELADLPPDPALRTAVGRHLVMAVSAWFGYGLAWALQVKAMLPAAAVAALAAFALLLVAGHAGARVVYHHGFPGRTGNP